MNSDSDPPYELRRPDTPDEWDAYHHIRRNVMLESREYALAHPDQNEELAPLHYPMMLWLEGCPIGTIRIDNLNDGTAALRLVAIDPASQAQGHGRALLQLAEAFARGLGCGRTVVFSTPEAAGFYASAGYVEGAWDDAYVSGIVHMAKTLSD
jgi:GNAT superfamily N-acetyltransferase